ncbi:MAG: transcriptional regulator [Micrococcales bacterium 70-64]|nr:winged helix-turn-helix transcriptional regulator [Leifsonia sp.]ODU63451.1 MAG: transcriptional regulator [Leifsonia sp. SCN 70-46]OJX85142.1 MAG: transcriptional regulator [Micrococcales bacterium 70-64]
MADIFDVVSDPTRREVMAALLERAVARDAAAGEISVGDLVERLGLSQPTVSKHLRVLRDHGLVTVREDGQHRYYRLDPAPLEDLEDWIRPYLEPSLDEEDVPLDDGRSAVFAAWSGADVGETIGRRAAESAHRVARTLPRTFRRRLFGRPR